MNVGKYIILTILLSVAFCPYPSQARFHRGGRFIGFPAPGWQRGYWFHGAYMERSGWWWIVGPGWYYYPAPLYPYPPAGAEAVYVVQVPNAPPPPPAPGTSSTTAPVAPAPPTGAVPTTPTNKSGQVSQKAFTYYCEKSKGYYPQVNNCTDGWVATPVKAPN